MPRLGTRKLYHLLREEFEREQLHIGRDALFRLLREEQLLLKRTRHYTKTTYSKHWMKKYPNLIKDLVPQHPEQIWVADITYLPIREGYCYLHLITDAYSKQIMGYKVSENLNTASTLQALQMALQQRQYTTTLTHHSDRGLQYCSAAYIKLLTEHHCKISMTQDGNPYDNAIAERINGILKQEFGLEQNLHDLNEAQKLTDQAITLYNQSRPHLSCHYHTPHQMHQQQTIKLKSWRKKNLPNPCGI